jgi:hypothetical protein
MADSLPQGFEAIYRSYGLFDSETLRSGLERKVFANPSVAKLILRERGEQKPVEKPE